MEFLPTNGACGAEVRGVDPATATHAEGVELRAALLEHRLLVFRDVSLSPAEQVTLLKHFQRPIVEFETPEILADPSRAFGKVSFVTTKPDEYISGRYGLGFHSDFAYFVDGACAVLSLQALEAERDDPTIFADMGVALKRLPDNLADTLRNIELVKCCNFYHNTPAAFGPRYRMIDRDQALDYGPTVSIHPAVARHPVSGVEFVNVCQTFTSHVAGWSYADSDQLFSELERWQYAEDNEYRHRWQPRDLVIWDNIILQHGRGPLTGSFARHLQRVAANSWDFNELLQRTADNPPPAASLAAAG